MLVLELSIHPVSQALSTYEQMFTEGSWATGVMPYARHTEVHKAVPDNMSSLSG